MYNSGLSNCCSKFMNDIFQETSSTKRVVVSDEHNCFFGTFHAWTFISKMFAIFLVATFCPLFRLYIVPSLLNFINTAHLSLIKVCRYLKSENNLISDWNSHVFLNNLMQQKCRHIDFDASTLLEFPIPTTELYYSQLRIFFFVSTQNLIGSGKISTQSNFT